MAAQHEQVEAVVEVPSLRAGPLDGHHAVLPGPPGRVAAEPVDHPMPRHGGQPGQRVARPMRRPLPHGLQDRLLYGVLARLELAGPAAAQQPAEDLRTQRAQQVLDRGRRVQSADSTADITGRTSMAQPSIRASGSCCASTTARSRDSTSKT